jgi:hypothetical protein
MIHYNTLILLSPSSLAVARLRLLFWLTGDSLAHDLRRQLTFWTHRKVKVKMLRPTVSPDVKHPSGAQGQIFITFVDVGHSLTTGRVSLLQLLLVLASAVILGPQSRGTHNILLSGVRDCPNLESQAPVFISPSNRVAQLYPQVQDSIFVASYDSQDHGRGT